MNEGKLDERKLDEQFKSGASWFYWIAGLSLVNVIMTIINGSWGFVFGLGITELIDYVTYLLSFEFGKTAYYIGTSINIFILGIFAILGRLANRRHNWSFIVGMILYVLDGFLLVWMVDYMSALFHLYPLYFIFKGYKANRQLQLSATSVEEFTEVQLNFRSEMQDIKEKAEQN